jgi:hypothetical protein
LIARAAVVVVLVIVGAACEAVVTDDVPQTLCVPAPGACPSGQTCDPGTHRCAPDDAAAGDDAPSGDDAAVFPLKGCSTLGCACSGPADCMSGICADTTIVSAAVHDAAQMSAFCTATCCTSADCDSATVCLATGTGQSYCVLPQWIDRSATPGALTGGSSCESDGACRSALCVSGTCADVCCSTAQSAKECANGDVCQFGTFPGRSFDKAFVPFCAPGVGTAPSGSACTADSTCLSGLCPPEHTCHDACRSTADCTGTSVECGYAFPGLGVTQIVAVCEASAGTVSQAEEGAPCNGNDTCLSGFCDAKSMKCTDVCYTDADCTPAGWRCRPDVSLTFGSMTYSVFACGG